MVHGMTEENAVEKGPLPDAEPTDSSSQGEQEDDKNKALNDWDGPDDPGNPRNWSLAARLYGVAIPAWYSLAVTFGTSVYAAGVPDVMTKFQVSRTVATLGLSLYAIGIGLGPVLGAPISETLGRKWVYLLTMPLSLLFTMGAGLGKNLTTVLVCRFLSSLVGAPAVAVGAGSVADLWDMQAGGAIAGTFFILMPFLGSSLGPLIGGYAVQDRHTWAWTMWTIIMIGGPAWLAALPMRETYGKIILKKRALARGVPPPPKPPPKEALKTLITVTLFRPIHMLLVEPIIGWMSLYVAFAFGILFAFFDAFPYVFANIYHFDLGQIGLTYLGIIIGILLAAVTFGIIDKTIYARSKARVKEGGKIPPPEERLYACMMGSIALPISLFWFGWSSREDVHWICPVIAGVPFGWGLVLLFLGTSCYLVDAYQALNAASAIAASAIAANSLLRYLFAAAFPLFTVQMYEHLGVGWAASLLAFVSIGMLPIPWILYKWGPTLRRRSAYKMGNFSELVDESKD